MLLMPLLGMGRPLNGLVNDLGMDTTYSSTQAGAAVEITVTIATTGGWTVTVGAGDTLGGTPSSGTWLNAGTAGEHQVRFTASGEINSPTITNGASTFTAVSANRTFKVEKNTADASCNCLIEIQKTIGGRILTETIALEVNGA